MDEWIGKSLRRKEDARFITGSGNYVAYIADKMPDATYMSIVRSPHAKARIKSVTVDHAASSSGVLCVLTGKDLTEAGIGGLPCAWPTDSRNGTDMAAPYWLR